MRWIDEGFENICDYSNRLYYFVGASYHNISLSSGLVRAYVYQGAVYCLYSIFRPNVRQRRAAQEMELIRCDAKRYIIYKKNHRLINIKMLLCCS